MAVSGGSGLCVGVVVGVGLGIGPGVCCGVGGVSVYGVCVDVC